MKGLKIILWICAISCLVGFVGAVVPWKVITALYQVFDVQPFTSEPVSVYTFRVFLVMTGMIGIFFVILARNPLKYDVMLKLAAYGLVFFGVICLLFGFIYWLPVWLYIGDALFCIIAGLLLLAFRKKVV
ncbi:MAG: hypothetical protein MUP22_13300 [Desulfobacterales bacterium]|nr:hypothetical protein [Desulfobacterales bacterium]